MTEEWRRRDVRGARVVGFWICCVQGLSMGIVSVDLACGGYGPTMLPSNIHNALWFELSGASILSTYILALVLREKARTLRQFSQVSIYNVNKGRIWVFGVVLVGGDVFVSSRLVWSVPGLVNYVGVTICILELAVAAFFSYHAVSLVRVFADMSPTTLTPDRQVTRP